MYQIRGNFSTFFLAKKGGAIIPILKYILKQTFEKGTLADTKACHERCSAAAALREILSSGCARHEKEH